MKARQENNAAHAVEIKRKQSMRTVPRGDGEKRKLQLKKWSALPAVATMRELCDTAQLKSAESKFQIFHHVAGEAQHHNEYQVVSSGAGFVEVHGTVRG